MEPTKVHTRLNAALDAAPKTKITLHDSNALTAADTLAEMSECRPHRVGAVIFRRGKILVGAVNEKRSHPIQAKWNRFSCNLHAEIACLIKCYKRYPSDLEGSSIAVARVSRSGLPGCSYPCEHCFPALVASGVRRIVCYDATDSPVSVTI